MHLINMLRKRLIRYLVRAVSVFLPQEKAVALERLRRGREEFLKYRRTDYVIASYGKSGRTWLRILLSRYYQLTCGIPERIIMGFDNFHRINPAVPAIFWTHDNYLKSYSGNRDSKRDYYHKKVVLLVRRPQDVAVSQFFQWKHRMRADKMLMNKYPPHGSDISMYDFVMDENVGLPRIVDFLNLWASEFSRLQTFLMVRYEDMRADPVEQMRRLVEFLGAPVDPEQLAAAVEFSSVENLRKLERQDYFWRSGSRLTPKDRGNPDSYKVRRAKVGGYRDYFDDEQVAEMDAFVETNLAPIFGYRGKVRETMPGPSARVASGG
ncbi:MAG: sulfotransferase domain-containing protein [Gammaproteobacteria bacterium]|nr:sulfotransferase domain-containing protein [Gammaproteobacteria bacterium]